MKIVRDPRICGGRFTIAGTRLEVTFILERLMEYLSWEDVAEEYPVLSRYTIKQFEQALRNPPLKIEERLIKDCLENRNEDACNSIINEVKRREERLSLEELNNLMNMLSEEQIPENTNEYMWYMRFKEGLGKDATLQDIQEAIYLWKEDLNRSTNMVNKTGLRKR